VKPQIDADHGAVRFTMKRAAPLTVEFNGDIRRVVHLFAYEPEKDPPAAGSPNVRAFGPGVHEAGIIEPADGETIYLAPGAWVKGAIRVQGKKNVTIRGRGVLDAAGLPPWTPPPPGAPRQRPFRNVIGLEHTDNARVEGITLFNAPSWTFVLRGAKDTHVDGIRILSWSQQCGTDGIDIVSSPGTLIEHAFIRSNDDDIAVKNLENVDTRDITVRHSTFWNMPCGNGMEVGFETRGTTTEHVRFQDIDVIHVERGAAISIHHGDSGTVRDVAFEDIRVEDARHKLIDFAIVYGVYGPDRPTPEQRNDWEDVGGAWDAVLNVPPSERARVAANRGVVRDVKVRNLHVVEGDLPYSIVAGFSPDRPIENVVIENLRYRGRPIRSATDGRFSVSDVKGLTFR
jgi:polygalacturonase